MSFDTYRALHLKFEYLCLEFALNYSKTILNLLLALQFNLLSRAFDNFNQLDLDIFYQICKTNGHILLSKRLLLLLIVICIRKTEPIGNIISPSNKVWAYWSEGATLGLFFHLFERGNSSFLDAPTLLFVDSLTHNLSEFFDSGNLIA